MPVSAMRRPVRFRSESTFLAYPLVSVAIGPDLATGELRGHARGMIAVGDIATGVIAVGGVARGIIALGGLAIGALALGGGALGLLAFGGLAVGLGATGGLAVGYVAVGGLALGYYAAGGAAFGKFVVSALRQDPDAVEFFRHLAHGIFLPPRLR
jgi:hypothetical protein